MKIYFKMRKLPEGGKIVIKGRETIEIIFDQGSNFKEIEIEFDEMSEHPANDHKAEEEQLEQTADDHKAEEEQLEQPVDDHEIEEPIQPEEALEKIASESESFEEFVDKISSTLTLGKREEIFRNLLFAAMEMEKVSWSTIKASVSYTDWDKIFISRQITENFGMKILKFFNEVKFYSTNMVWKKSDQSQPEKVLSSMGIEEISPEKKEIIITIANTAVVWKDIKDIQKILAKTNIPRNMWNEARMIFSEFVNSYRNKHNLENMSVQEFLESLRK